MDAQGQDWIRRASNAAAHLQQLIRDMLDYSRLDSRTGHFQPVELRDVVERAVSLNEASLREAAAELVVDELPRVSGDASQLVQLMLNLVGNALKYRGAEAPRIHLSAERTGAEWTVSVRDNGIGVPPKHHHRIFEVFKRLHDQSKYPGSGIGLSVCRRIVETHGGKIWVESDGKRGSVFRFTLPANEVPNE